MRTVVAHGLVLDTDEMVFLGERDVVIDDGVIVEVVDRHTGSADRIVDAAGRFVVPGLIDAHVHLRLATMDFRLLANMSEVEFGIGMATLARETLSTPCARRLATIYATAATS